MICLVFKGSVVEDRNIGVVFLYSVPFALLLSLVFLKVEMYVRRRHLYEILLSSNNEEKGLGQTVFTSNTSP